MSDEQLIAELIAEARRKYGGRGEHIFESGDLSHDLVALCDALEAALKREANWKALYVDACDSYLGLGDVATEAAEKSYRRVYGEDA